MEYHMEYHDRSGAETGVNVVWYPFILVLGVLLSGLVVVLLFGAMAWVALQMLLCWIKRKIHF